MIYKITIKDRDDNILDVTDNVNTGFSEHLKLGESLDVASMTISHIDREEVFGMFDVVFISVNTKLYSYRIQVDNVTLVSKRPSLYKHELTLIEPIKLLEREIVNGFKVTQPTDGSFTYTLYDVVERLRKTVPLEKNDLLDETRLFIVSNEAKTVLESIVSPEFTWNNYTLRQCLDEVCGLVDGIAKIDGNGLFTIQFFNETFDLIGSIDETFNDKRRSQDIEFYATNMEISAINLINDNENAQSVEIYPANGYTTIRSDEYYVDFLKSYVPTPKKLYNFQKLFVLSSLEFELRAQGSAPIYSVTTNGLYPLELSDRVVEENLYRTLDVYFEDVGIFTDEASLLSGYPNGIATPTDRQGYIAFINSTNTTWQWDVNNNQWADSGLLEPLSQFSALKYKQYSPNISVNDTFGLFDTKTILDNVIEASESQIVNGNPFPLLEYFNLLEWWDGTQLIDPRFGGNYANYQSILDNAPRVDDAWYIAVDTGSGWQYDLATDSFSEDTAYDPYNVILVNYIGNYGSNEKEYSFQTHYIPMQDDMVIDVERDDVSDVYYKLSLLSNQQARIIDFNDLTNRAKGKINRIGNEDLSYSHTVQDPNDLFKLGDYTVDDYIVSECEYIYFKDYIVGKYSLTKNFNRVSKFIGINSQVRQWEIPINENTQTRNFKYKDYCLVDIHNENTSVGLNTGKALLDDGKDTILETIYSGTSLEPARAGYMINPYTNDVLYLDVSSNASKANMLVFNYKTKNNKVLADRVVTDGARLLDNNTSNIVGTGEVLLEEKILKVQDAIEGVPYTDTYGRLNELNSYIITSLGGKTTLSDYIQQGRNLPLIDPLQTPVNRQVIDLSDFPIEKDGGEVLKFTYQVDFFAKNKNVILGKEYFKMNRLISENKIGSGLQIYLYNDLTLRNKDSVFAPTPDATYNVNGVRNDGVIQASWISVDKTNNRYLFTFNLDGYASWALVTSDGKTLFGVNQPNKQAYYNMTFDFTHFRDGVSRIKPSPFGDIGGVINVDSNFTFEHKPYKLVESSFSGSVSVTPNFTFEHQPYESITGNFSGVINVNSNFTYETDKPKVASSSFSGNVNTTLNLTYGTTKFKSASGSFSGTVGTSLGFTYDPCWEVCTFDVVDTYFSATDESVNTSAQCGNNVTKTICTYDTQSKQWLCTDYIGVVTTECAV